MYKGNARIQGMTADLNMEGSDYNMALFIFFIPVSRTSKPLDYLGKRLLTTSSTSMLYLRFHPTSLLSACPHPYG